MSRPTAVLDACVLIPIRLTTTLLWLAEAGLTGTVPTFADLAADAANNPPITL